MNAKAESQKEPTLADLEAFERLLRESMNHGALAQPVTAPPAPPPEPVHASSNLLEKNAAFLELTRLMEAPLNFDAPGLRNAEGQARPAQESGQVDQTQAPQWPSNEEVKLHDEPRLLDPTLNFEEEMRRLHESGRINQSYSSSSFYSQYNPKDENTTVAFESRKKNDDYSLERYDGLGFNAAQDDRGQRYTQKAGAEGVGDGYTSGEVDALDDVDARLAAEAAFASAQFHPGTTQRSRSVFYALGGIAILGLAVIGGSLAFGSRKSSSQSIPVIAAKTDPTKEKPASPGGIEIPDQNRQILASRTAAPDTRPSQIVTTTEQPLDLNQVTKRDPVRVITPSPYPPAASTDTPSADTATPPNPATGDIKRVQSVKLSDPLAPSSMPNPAPAAASVARPQNPAESQNPAENKVPSSLPTPPVVQRQAVAAPTTPSSPPAKVETRPVTATTPATPTTTQTGSQTRPPQTANPAPRQANAPLDLLNPSVKAPDAGTKANPAPRLAAAPRAAPAESVGSGAYAIQLAARPTEADANSASSQLTSRYSSQLGGKPGNVVSGEVNGKTIYRVRVNGFDQAGATSACAEIKAAGGGCFVTRQ